MAARPINSGMLMNNSWIFDFLLLEFIWNFPYCHLEFINFH